MKWRKLLIVSLVVLPGCSTMRPVESPVTYLENNNPKHVRVYAQDGELYVLRDPQLRGDTIRGYESLVQEELSLTVDNIQRMEAMQPDKGRTTLFVGAMAVIGAAGIYMATKSGDGAGLICDDYTLGQRCREPGVPAAKLLLKIPMR